MSRNVTILVIILVILLISGYLLWLRGKFQAVSVPVTTVPTIIVTPSATPTIASPSATATPSGTRARISPTRPASTSSGRLVR